MKDRVVKNIVTTVIGIFIVLFSMIAFWFKRLEMDTFFVMLTAGCAALGLKDTIFKGKP